MIYHGWEVFDEEKMNGYGKWMTDLKFPAPLFMAYLGKGSELVCGVLILIGWLTRPAAIILAITMFAVAFGMGHGRIFTDDQHPFLFVVLSLVFVFTGAGKYSIDYYMDRRR
jgi:putative oxidoreductase